MKTPDQPRKTQSTRKEELFAREEDSVCSVFSVVHHAVKLDIGKSRLMPGIPQRVVEAMTKGESIRGLA